MQANSLISGYPPLPTEKPAGTLSAATSYMRSRPWWFSCLPPSIMTLLMGWLDCVTGWELSLFIFYAVPITFAVWWSGARAGFFMSLMAGAVWWAANETTHPYETQFGYAWALVNRVFYFCVVVFAASAVRGRQDEDAARIRMLVERRQLESDIVSVSEYEQQRIGQDLHDGVCQNLAAIGCAAQALADDLQARELPDARDAAMIAESVRQATVEARDLARGIFPVHVDRSGLAAALGDLARMTSRLTGAEISFREEGEAHLENPEAAMHLYRIAQEAVANAVRHGQARRVDIGLLARADELQLKIADDGAGIRAGDGSKGEGMGLRTMRYRAQVLGAGLEITSGRSGGTTLTCTLPLAGAAIPHGHVAG